MKYESSIVAELFAGLPPADRNVRAPLTPHCTWANYKGGCEQRWGGWALRDALNNWDKFEKRKDVFRQWCDHYRRDPQMYVGPKAHNPEGTLTSMVWVMQTALEPDRSCLNPCLDFEEHFQTVFIRRGLMIYLTLLLKEMEP